MLNALRNTLASAVLLAAWGCEVTKVTSPDIQSITLSASATTVVVGSQITIEASLVDNRGRPLDRPVTWTADGPQVQVSGNGLTASVRGVSAGTVSLRAESEGVVSPSVTISVQNAAGPNVDLTLTALTAAPTGVVRGTIQVSVTVANIGTTASGPFTLGVYYSTDATITTSDVFSGSGCNYPSGLAAGASDTCSGQVQVPAALPPGMYFVGAIADDLLQVTEANESNNSRAAAARTTISAPASF
jgi:hypothetical protein